MLLESLIEAKVPCEVLIPPPGPSIPRMSRPKVSVVVSTDGGSALQSPPPALLAEKDNTGGGGGGGTVDPLSAFVAPEAARKSSGGSSDRETSGAEGVRLSEGCVLRKSSAGVGRSLTIDTRRVETGSPRDSGDGISTSRMPSSSSSSSSSPPSSFQSLAGGGSGRIVDSRGTGVNINQTGGIQPARRTIGQAFRPGELECDCRYSRRFLLYHRLQPKAVLGTLASSTLESFRVDGRNGLYVCPDKEGNVFYMTLMEVRHFNPSEHLGRFVALFCSTCWGDLL